MRAAYFESPLRPRRLARRDRNGYPAIEASRRRRPMKLPPIAELMAMPRTPRSAFVCSLGNACHGEVDLHIALCEDR